MKQKYIIQYGEGKNQLIVREMAELDKGLMSVLFEETLELAHLEQAVKSDRNTLINAIRTPSFYPTAPCAEKLADAIKAFIRAKNTPSVEVIFDDAEFLAKETAEKTDSDDADDGVEIDKLLDEDADTYNQDEEDIKAISSPKESLKVADDDSALPEEDEK
jgi:hypothetical protein